LYQSLDLQTTSKASNCKKFLGCRFLTEDIKTLTTSFFCYIHSVKSACLYFSIFKYSHLKSDFLFLEGFPSRFSRPFIFTNFTFFQITSYHNLLTPTLRTSLFSTHESIRSISRISIFSYQLLAIIFIERALHYLVNSILLF